jgi:hypothetical protein
LVLKFSWSFSGFDGIDANSCDDGGHVLVRTQNKHKQMQMKRKGVRDPNQTTSHMFLLSDDNGDDKGLFI